MTTEAHDVTTTDELLHLFVGGVGGGHVSPRCFVDTWNCEGTPDDHRSSRGDDRRRASPSFCWRCGRRTCFPKVFCGHLEVRGRPMTTEAHEVTTTDELRHLFVGGVGGGHVSPRCFVDTWNCEGTPNNWLLRGNEHRPASPSLC